MLEPPVFDGGRLEAKVFLSEIGGQHYVYVLCRPDGRPFYVGKGLGRRALEHESEARRHHPLGESNPFKCNVIRKLIREGGQVRYQIAALFDPDRQQDCLAREADLILKFRRLHEGGPLTNLAGGIGNLSGAAPFSLERHAATLSGEPENNPDRSTLNRFLRSIGPVDSVPIKPIRQITKILPTTPHPKPRQPTLRSAYALMACASASRLQFSSGVRLPRAFEYEGVTAIIENGVSRDLVKAGMAELIASTDPQLEFFRLAASHGSIIERLVGRHRLIDLGLV